ncbi:MAG: leucine-rich repeat domain-containing protein [Cyclobacteriaceae bacterium]
MTRTKLTLILFSVLFLGAVENLQSQDLEQDSIRANQEVLGIVNFYKYLLNTVGSSESVTRDKEVIINESYKKIFLNENVQIEDDLTNDRRVITNKDVSAYLRDVDFFFENIEFSFEDIKITSELLEDTGSYYLVSFESVINGTTLDGDKHESRTPRFMEINIDEAKADLKIASIYTTKISREEELKAWYENLPQEWLDIFSDKLNTEDSLSLTDFLSISKIDSLDLGDNQHIQSLAPLEMLRDLEYLDISSTRISDLTPIRTCVKLKSLIARETLVDDIDVLQYFKSLQVLDISESEVMNIGVLSKMTSLTDLNLAGIKATTFYALVGIEDLRRLNLSRTVFSQTDILVTLDKLVHLDLSNTGIETLSGLDNLEQLEVLDCSETYIKSLTELTDLGSLREISFIRTQISSLDPLNNISALRRVNADFSGVSEEVAGDFMSKNKGVVVITNSEKVMEWWSALSEEYRRIFSRKMNIQSEPTKVDLIKLLNIDSLELSGLRLLEGTPLTKFKKLKYLDVSKNLFVNITFTKEMEELQTFIGTNLPTDNFAPLAQNRKLERITINGSLVKSIGALQRLADLTYLNISDTEVTEDQVFQFLDSNPETIIIYRSEELHDWWGNLTPTWKQVFNISEVNDFTLHKLAQERVVRIEDVPVTTLIPLKAFINLNEVFVSNTQVNHLKDLRVHEQLQKITCKNGPLLNLEEISRHSDLQYLDISNTAVDDLRMLSELVKIEVLDASGTSIKNVKGLENLRKLKSLNISNTRVWQLDRLYDIRTLKSVTCYNTRLRSNKISEFKELMPNCEVTYY